jgi:hypothetical protein
MARRVVSGAGVTARAVIVQPRIIAKAGINLFFRRFSGRTRAILIDF